MNATRVKELLSPIPADEFIRYLFTNEVDKCCAGGHLLRLISKDHADYSIGNLSLNADALESFNRLVGDFALSIGLPQWTQLGDINNNPTMLYPQQTPKERIMVLLEDMITANY